MKEIISSLIKAAVATYAKNQNLSVDIPDIQVEAVKNKGGSREKQHGDFASNVALALAKPFNKNPRDLAAELVSLLPSSEQILKVEIAGPGFINFFISDKSLQNIIAEIVTLKEKFGGANLGHGVRVLLEFVSSNPTGPLHVGHGRHAAFGAVVANLLTFVGFVVHREYYVNDAGRQMDILATSVWLRYLELCGESIVFPANGYKGEYIIEIAQQLLHETRELQRPAKDVFHHLPLDEIDQGDKELYIDALIVRSKQLLGNLYDKLFDQSLQMILQNIREDLAEFGVTFDQWFSEKSFTATDIVDQHIAHLQKENLVYEDEGALWFRSSQFGDEKDRVIQRANGAKTYFANDLIYHIDKFARGFDFAIDIFGSDHHGYIPRMQAGLEAAGITRDKLTYLTVQFVSLYRQGAPVPMSTRSGSFVTLRELREEVGNDAARFFYVMRKLEQPMDFDLDLAKSKSNENPVYYVQYAHARICSVFRQLSEKSFSFDVESGLAEVSLLTQPHELELLTKLAQYPEIIKSAALQYEPHLLTNYLRDLAGLFHAYYNAHAFLVEDIALRNSRLVLIFATRIVFANGLKLLGVSSPESM